MPNKESEFSVSLETIILVIFRFDKTCYGWKENLKMTA